MSVKKGLFGLALACLVTLTGCAKDVDWPGYGGADENHFSPLDQINQENVGKLGLAWHYDIQTPGSAFTAPVEADGVLYFAGGLSHVHALDAKTGKLLWQYDPKVAENAGFELRESWGSRGMAYANGRVFVGTMDGRLIALDAKTGALAWSAQTTTKGDGRYITGAPWVFKDKVIIGHGGADYNPVRGYATAYDQATGKQAWRFYTVPGDPAKGFENKTMEMAAKTWKGDRWKEGGGGTVWNAMAYDPKYNRIYLGTGNGAPWNQKIRSPGGGDNLFLCSVIAVDADTGEYVWHYQFNPGESWDYNAAMDMALSEVKIDGKPRDVLMTAPKNGFFYVIDRSNGKFISAGQIEYQNWAKGIDKNGRPIEIPEARYPDGKPYMLFPSMIGAHGPEAMSYSPKSGLAYIPVRRTGGVYIDPPAPIEKWQWLGRGQPGSGTGAPPPNMVPPPTTSSLLAWDPVRQREAWRIPFKSSNGGGGTLATAGGLVFQGRTAGKLVALAAESGKELWSFDSQYAIGAQPISYSVGGKQYVSVVAGGRFLISQGLEQVPDYRTQQWRVLTFALDGTDRLPAKTTQPAPFQDDPAFRVDPAKAAAGNGTFMLRCVGCHGFQAIAGGAAPNLLRSPIPLDFGALKSVLHDGVLLQNGMPKFEELTDEQIAQIQHFIRQRAREEIAAEAKPKR